MRKSLSVMLTLGLLGLLAVNQATAQVGNDGTLGTVVTHGTVIVFTPPSTGAQTGAGIDFVNAQPMELPSVPGVRMQRQWRT